MDAWVVWIIIACALGVGEIATGGFFLAPFAAGAGLAAITDAVGLGDAAAAIVFLVSSLLFLAVVRPIARSHIRIPPQLRTGTAALVGRQGLVLERIANDEGVGCVKIDGEVWTARAYDEDKVIEAGVRVHVMDIRGATALVSE